MGGRRFKNSSNTKPANGLFAQTPSPIKNPAGEPLHSFRNGLRSVGSRGLNLHGEESKFPLRGEIEANHLTKHSFHSAFHQLNKFDKNQAQDRVLTPVFTIQFSTPFLSLYVSEIGKQSGEISKRKKKKKKKLWKIVRLWNTLLRRCVYVGTWLFLTLLVLVEW